MREFVVSEAPRDRVAALARATVEDIGGVVAQSTERATEFDHLEPSAGDWSRAGYVGTYKRYGEPPVRLRIRVWAEWPRKLFLWSVFLGLVQAVVFFSLALVGLSPPSNVWILSAIVTFALIGIGLLMYSSSWADSRDLEEKIARRLTGELSDDEEIPGDVYTLGEWEAYRAQLIDQAVEAAETKAPERPSRTQRLLERVGVADGPEEQVEAEEEPATADEPEEAEEEEEDEDEEGLLDRVAFWRSSDGDEEEDEPDEEAEREPEEEPAQEQDVSDEEPAQEEAEDDEEDDEGLLDRVAFWKGSDGDEEEDEPDEEQEDAEEERAAASEPEEADEEEEAEDEEDEGLLDRVAFWKGSDDEEEPADAAEADDAGDEDVDPEVAEKRKRLEELKRKKEAAEADESD